MLLKGKEAEYPKIKNKNNYKDNDNNNGNFICVFECTIVNLATYRQFTNAAWDWITYKKKKDKKQKTKKQNKTKQNKNKTKAKKKKEYQNCIESGLSQFLFLQQKM